MQQIKKRVDYCKKETAQAVSLHELSEGTTTANTREPLMMSYHGNKAAALTVAFLMAVRMSMVLSPPRGSTDSNVLPNVSWNM